MADPFQMEMGGAAVETLAGLRLRPTRRRRASAQQLWFARAAQRSPVALQTKRFPGCLHQPVPALPRSRPPTPELTGTVCQDGWMIRA